jgi:hypothetical protein
MKIRKVEATHVAIPYQHGGPLSVFGFGTTRATMDSVYIRVDTEEGVTGWGEAFGFGACPVTAAAVNRVVAPLAIGREAEDIGALVQDIRRRAQNMGHNGPVGFALSGFDTALWDIAGKRAGQPIHRLLGGARTKREFRPTPACCASTRRRTSERSAQRRSPGVTGTSSCTNGPLIPLRRPAKRPARISRSCSTPTAAGPSSNRLRWRNSSDPSIFPGWKNLHIRPMIMPGLRASAEKAASRRRLARISAISTISGKCSMLAQST